MKLTLYYREIFQFLQSCCIKFSPFELTYINRVLTDYGIDLRNHPESNPYYLHLLGERSEYLPPIEIFCPEKEIYIPLNRSNLKKYPKASALYRIGNKEFTSLLQAYPNESGTIKNIIYGPDIEMKELLEKRDLSLLSFDESLIETNEKESLLKTIRDFLDVLYERWYTTSYCYEDLYAPVLYATIFNILPPLLLAQRIANLHTNSVHSYHIWEFLKSHGLSNYSSILSSKEALFLYRNIDYIMKNRGKMSNLKLLAENLLSSLRITLVQKNVHLSTSGFTDTSKIAPEITSKPIVDFRYIQEENEIESPEKIFQRLKSEKKMTDSPMEEEIQRKALESSPQEKVLTKLMELKQNTISTRYNNFLAKYIFHNVLYMVNNNKLNYQLKLVDDLAHTPIKLSPKDMLLLFFYANSRANGFKPKGLPKRFILNNVLKANPVIPDEFYCMGDKLKLTNIFYPKDIRDEVSFDYDTFDSINEFRDFYEDSFLVIIKHLRLYKSGCGLEVLKGIEHLYKNAFMSRDEALDLGSYKDFNEFIESNKLVKDLVSVYDDEAESKMRYGNLATNILELLAPTNGEKLKYFFGINPEIHKIYDELKKLFIQLCSYTVTFLDTTRDFNEYESLNPIGGYSGRVHKKDIDPIFLFRSFSLKTKKRKFTIHKLPLKNFLDFENSKVEKSTELDLNYSFPCDTIKEEKKKFYSKEKLSLTETKRIVIREKINIHLNLEEKN